MRTFITITIVCAGAVMLIGSGIFLNNIELELHHHPFINGLAKYQLLALIIGCMTMVTFLTLNPQSKIILRIGDLSTIAEKEKWLGINGKSTWFKNGLQLLAWISLATGIFMFSGVAYTHSLNNFHWWFIPYVVLFSLTNSFAEEMIFRFGLIAGLENYYPKIAISILSAILFGLPHYFGNPGGLIGVVMSGLLGYILCKATIETKGIAVAWKIHFVQDIIIFTAVMMMSIK